MTADLSFFVQCLPAEIQNVISTAGVTPVWDKTAAVKYIVWDSNQWVSYDDADTFKQVNLVSWTDSRMEPTFLCRKSTMRMGNHSGASWCGAQIKTMLPALLSQLSSVTRLSSIKEVSIKSSTYRLHAGVKTIRVLLVKTTSEAASNTFNTGQICTVSGWGGTLLSFYCRSDQCLEDCNTDDSCPAGYTALTVTKGKPTQPTYQCKKNQHREVCCPSSSVPQGCTWRGTAPFCNGIW